MSDRDVQELKERFFEQRQGVADAYPVVLPETLAALVVRPGDSLILHTEQRLTDADFKYLQQHLEERLPGVKAVILGGITVAGVYRPDLVTEAPKEES